MAKIKIMGLGGLGENGKNMYVIDVDNKIFILDSGMKYPDIDMYGIDAVIPNIDYLISRKNDIQGIFISHGHEDQIGAIPYLLKNLPVRVYGTHFTISVIENIMAANKMDINKFKLYRINANKIMRFNDVSVTFFNTTHSIPESMGICITTKDGNIVYCTDFNFGASSNGTYQTTFDKITDIGKTRVLALLSESVNAGAIGRIANDSLLEHNYKNILSHHHERIIIGAFSTDLIRIQKIIDLSVEANRKICVIAKKGERIIEVAIKSNYLRIPDDLYFDISNYTKEELGKLKDVVIIVTGFRNEPYATLVKMAIDDHSIITFNPNDKVILMCPPIPGTEKMATDAINTLYEYDTNLTIFDKSILRSAHASPEDLKMLYSMLRPEYVIPIKGEYRHMYEQKLVAKAAGYDLEHILMLDNGDVVTFNGGKLSEEIDKIHVGDIFIDGTSIGVVDSDVIAERSALAEEGVIFIYLAVNVRNKQIIGNISSTSRGFTHSFSDVELNNALSGLVERIVNNNLKKKTWNRNDVCVALSEEVQKIVWRYTKHRPIIEPIIVEL